MKKLCVVVFYTSKYYGGSYEISCLKVDLHVNISLIAQKWSVRTHLFNLTYLVPGRVCAGGFGCMVLWGKVQ